MKSISLTILFIISLAAAQAQRVHLISALGCDSSIYSGLSFDTALDIHYVAWLKPLRKESLDAYCDRLIAENEIRSGDILVGTSFGGIVASVIARKVHPQATILISSISKQEEKPPKFKFMQIFRCHKIVPRSLLNKPWAVIGKCFGKVNSEERNFLSAMIEKSDPDLVAWSIDQIMKFDDNTDIPGMYKVNGTEDKVFHARCIESDFIIEGTHLIVYNRAAKVSSILDSIIDSTAQLAFTKDE